MTEATIPFVEDHDDDQEGEGPSEAVAEILDRAAELELSLADFIELALFSIHAVAVELKGALPMEEGAKMSDFTFGAVATLERLDIASDILADIDFGDGPEEGEGEGEEGEYLAQAA